MSAHADIDIKIGGQTAADLGIKLGRLTLTEAMNEHSTFSLECLALDVPLAAWVRSGNCPDAIQKLCSISEVFDHGFGVALWRTTSVQLTGRCGRLPANR